MKKQLTEEQFLIYTRGPQRARFILDNDLPGHYRRSFKKLEGGTKFTWNWAAALFISSWFAYQGMRWACFLFSIVALMSWGSIFLILASDQNPYLALIPFFVPVLIAGFCGEKILIGHLTKKIQEVNFESLSEKTQLAFIERVGLTQEQYLSCIYGPENAAMLLQHNVPNHYRQSFTKFALGKKLTLNWAAAFFAQFWFLYRNLPHMQLWLNLPLIMSLATFVGLFCGDRLLFNSLSKQALKGNFEALPKGATKRPIWATLGVIMTALVLIPVVSMSFSDPKNILAVILVLTALTALYIIPLIYWIGIKLRIRAYRMNKTSSKN